MEWTRSCFITTFQEIDHGTRRLTFQEVDTLDHFGLSSESMQEPISSDIEVSIIKSNITSFTLT